MQWITQHKIRFIVIIVVVVATIWYGLSSSSSTPEATLTTISTTGSPTADATDQELVSTVLALRAVCLSGSIFQDPAFTSLQDFSTPIVQEQVGRANPFAPLTGSVP